MSKNQVRTRESKRERFSTQPAKQGKSARSKLVFLVAAMVVLIGAGAAFALQRPQASGEVTVVQGAAPVAATHGHEPYPQVLAQDGAIRFATSTFADGQAHHYTYMAGDQPIEFFVLKSSDGVIRAAFNACDVCFLSKQGYVQEGDDMVCLNCGRRFPSDQINVVEGGCNPSPLKRVVVDDMLVIDVKDIVDGARYF